MPLFSSNREDEENEDRRRDEGERETPEHDEYPPDEHTRLLPNRLDSNRVFLRPDDPAVSPYNLWTVRILRFVTIALALLSLVWWILLLVSAFATPPGFHTRGSGFFAFGYASLALFSLLFTLIFFGVPSKSVRITAIVMAVSTSITQFSGSEYEMRDQG